MTDGARTSWIKSAESGARRATTRPIESLEFGELGLEDEADETTGEDGGSGEDDRLLSCPTDFPSMEAAAEDVRLGTRIRSVRGGAH